MSSLASHAIAIEHSRSLSSTMTTLQQDATAPATTAASPPEIVHKSEKVRMPPSLNQLAARISSAGGSVTPAGSSQAVSRPRLAAQLLRTGSQVSLASTAASAGDSIAVNPPTTRSVSPDASSTRASSPLSSVAGSVNGGEPLTTEKVERLNAEIEKKPRVPGYKNIPSLDAITARMAMTRSLSIDGSPKPPEPETYEDPTTPGIPQKMPEHPLQVSWYVSDVINTLLL